MWSVMAGVAVLVMLCRGEAGEFRHVKGREVWTVEAGGVRSGEVWYCEARRGELWCGKSGKAWRVYVRSVGA